MNVKQLGAMCGRWRRNETDYTLSHLAKIAGVTESAVCKFETNGMNSLRIYCAYLSCGFKPPAYGIAAEAFAEKVGGESG